MLGDCAQHDHCTAFTMTRKLLLLSSLALLSCLQTVAGGEENAAFLRGEYLRQLAHDLRKLYDGETLPECPGTGVYLYYDANITIESMDVVYEDEEELCTDEDMVYVGEDLQKIVKELEKEYPKYANEFLETELCAAPDFEEIEEDEVYDVVGEGQGVDVEAAENDAIDMSPGAVTDPPTASPTESPSASPTQSPTPKATDKDGMDITVVTQKDKELPPWLKNRYLAKKVPTPTMEVLPEPTMAPSQIPAGRRLAAPTPKPTPKPTLKPTPKPTVNKKKAAARRRRRRKRFTFKSSGLCRTCTTDNKDRRRRIAETIDAEEAAEFAKETCDFASNSSFADEVAKKAAINCDKIVGEVENLAKEYNNKTVAETFVDDVEALLVGCKEQETIARNAAKLPPEWCELATDAVKEAEMRSKTQEYRDNAEQNSSDAVAAARRVHELNQEMMRVKINLKKLMLAQNFELQRADIEDLLVKQRADGEAIAQEMDETIAMLQDELKLAEDEITRSALEANQATIEKMKLNRDVQIQKMEQELLRMRDVYEAQLEFQIEEANLLLEMEGATNVSEWLTRFSDLLEHKIPVIILERNNCFVAEPNVTVTIVERPSKAMTYNVTTCTLPWDA